MGNKTDYIRFRVDGDIKRKLMEIQKETKQERK